VPGIDRVAVNNVLQNRIGYLLKRPVGRPPRELRRCFASFGYQAQSWKKPRRAVAKVEWHPGELYPRVGFVVTNLARLAERVVAFYNQRDTAEQWIKQGKGAIKWTRLSCRTFAANAVRLQLHALAYKLDNFMRTLAVPKAAEPRSLTSLNEKLVKIGAKVVSHGRYVTFQMARSRCRDRCSREFCRWSPGYGNRPRQHERREGPMRSRTMGKVRLDAGKALRFRASAQSAGRFDRLRTCGARFVVARDARRGDAGVTKPQGSGECRFNS
jgi:hypothetical protein